jgi:phosphoribosylamine--glycine ligase
VPLVSAADLEFTKTAVAQKVVDGMLADGTPYKGLLYCQMMLTANGPRVVEFNARFGDPETQVVMQL